MTGTSGLDLRLDEASSVAPFEQVRLRIVHLVGTGALLAGARIPTVRALAGQLGVAPNTIAKAYRALEADGIIETRGRAGSFVATKPDAVGDRAQAMTVGYVAAMRSLGFGDTEIERLIGVAIRQHAP